MKASVNNSLIHYIDIGISNATPVILIHGFPFSHRMWTFPGGQVEALASAYRVIAYDVRGHGESEVGDGQYTIELFVDDLIGLLDHLNIVKAVVVGLSMGGYIALRAIERNPDRFRALVLCDTKSEGDGNEAKVKRAASIKAVKLNGPKVFAENFVANVFTPESFNTKPDAIKLIQNYKAKDRNCGRFDPQSAATNRWYYASGSTRTGNEVDCPAQHLVGCCYFRRRVRLATFGWRRG